tara:strand:- start:69110 stop:70057 length:948 start_codon:yes stop_codon:yes gene_type:complete
MYDHILIDGKNMLYRAIFAGYSDMKFRDSKHHTINIILHFLTYYVDKFKPKRFHVFWDAPRTKTWRRLLDPEYKNNRNNEEQNKGKELDVDAMLANLTEVCTVLFKNMAIRQYYREAMEADDLIYAFCKMNPKDKILIVSSDGDLKQIPFQMANVDVHHPHVKRQLLEEVPEHDPVLVKSFMGDKSDNIDGYFKVGPVKAKLLSEDTTARHEFFQSEKSIIKVDEDRPVVGNQRFKENLRLIDLSLCPHLLDNMIYVSSKQFRPNRFDLNKIREVISKYKLRGVSAGVTRYIAPFKRLVEVTDGSSVTRSSSKTS